MARSIGFLIGLLPLLLVGQAWAHGVSGQDAIYLESVEGRQIIPFMYLGAKHMVTGYDHLLFLAGVVFFLYRLREVAIYVTLFAAGHSITLLTGVLADLHVNAYAVDAVIGLSVVYKGFDNLDGFKRWLGWQPNTKVAVALFGLVHGFGLATKLQDYSLSEDGLVPNILAFNVGVEVGQFLALVVIVWFMNQWRRTPSFNQHAMSANWVLMMLGFVLFFMQLAGLLLSQSI